MHPTTKHRMRAALTQLKAEWPATKGLSIKQLRLDSPGRPIYRLRVGPWRAVFQPGQAGLEVVRVFHRRDGYDWLEQD